MRQKRDACCTDSARSPQYFTFNASYRPFYFIYESIFYLHPTGNKYSASESWVHFCTIQSCIVCAFHTCACFSLSMSHRLACVLGRLCNGNNAIHVQSGGPVISELFVRWNKWESSEERCEQWVSGWTRIGVKGERAKFSVQLDTSLCTWIDIENRVRGRNKEYLS